MKTSAPRVYRVSEGRACTERAVERAFEKGGEASLSLSPLDAACKSDFLSLESLGSPRFDQRYSGVSLSHLVMRASSGKKAYKREAERGPLAERSGADARRKEEEGGISSERGKEAAGEAGGGTSPL